MKKIALLQLIEELSNRNWGRFREVSSATSGNSVGCLNLSCEQEPWMQGLGWQREERAQPEAPPPEQSISWQTRIKVSFGTTFLLFWRNAQCKTWELLNCRRKFVHINLSEAANKASDTFFPLLFWTVPSPTQLVKTTCNWNWSEDVSNVC